MASPVITAFDVAALAIKIAEERLLIPMGQPIDFCFRMRLLQAFQVELSDFLISNDPLLLPVSVSSFDCWSDCASPLSTVDRFSLCTIEVGGLIALS